MTPSGEYCCVTPCHRLSRRLLTASVLLLLTTSCFCLSRAARADRPNRPEKEKRHIPDEQRLMSRVFRSKSYDNSVRPVYNATDNVVVNFSVTLIQVMDMVSAQSH